MGLRGASAHLGKENPGALSGLFSHGWSPEDATGQTRTPGPLAPLPRPHLGLQDRSQGCLVVWRSGMMIPVFTLICFTSCPQLCMEVAYYCNKSPKPFLERTSHPRRSRRITEIAITEDLKKETISCADKAAAEQWSHCLLLCLSHSLSAREKRDREGATGTVHLCSVSWRRAEQVCPFSAPTTVQNPL